jgi:hypothetical protein
MTNQQNLELALRKLNEIVELIQSNEYEQFLSYHIILTQVELKRQLTNIQYYSKIKE